MAYIGKKPEDAFRGLAYYDTFTGDGSTTTFDLSADAPDGGQNDITVVVDNVRQEPGVSKSYTLGVDGSGRFRRITFNVAPDNLSEIYAINPGRSTQLNTVSDNAITAAKIQTDAVTTAKIQDDAVTTAKILNDAVTSAKIADGTIVSANIASGTIANDRLANSSITINGNAVSLGGSITAGTDWQAVVVADGSTQLNAVAGKGYFLDTNAGVIDVKLPSSPTRGDTIVLADYGNNFATNRVVVDTGGKLIDSVVGGEPGSGGFTIETNGAVVELVFADNTAGWIIKQNNAPSDLGAESYSKFITATGGTVTTSGDFKIHSFTGDGCFVVSCAGGVGTGPSVVDYLVVAGGGGGGASAGTDGAGAGGGGGFRESSGTASGSYTASPLAACVSGITVTTSTYPITVGGGGTPGSGPSNNAGTNGSNSVFSTITSAGGGAGAGPNSPGPGDGKAGGSGGGAAGGAGYDNTGGAGNTPPVSPSQGFPGGNSVAAPNGPPDAAAGGGGGATQAGEQGGILGRPAGPGGGGHGGDGAGTLINPATGEAGPGPSQYYAGGGGGSASGACSGGLGGGGDGGEPAGGAGTANTGGGAGGSSNTSGSGSGGSGIVIIRYKFQ